MNMTKTMIEPLEDKTQWGRRTIYLHDNIDDHHHKSRNQKLAIDEDDNGYLLAIPYQPIETWKKSIVITEEDEILKPIWSFSTQEIYKEGDWGYYRIPQKEKDISKILSKIEDEIKHSSYILDLEVGWDGEEAKIITPEIYNSSIQFLRTYSQYIFQHLGEIIIRSPEINPGRDGSIDLSWITENARMLINIKEYQGHPHVFFYGDHHENKNPLKGNIPAVDFEEALAVWMKKLV